MNKRIIATIIMTVLSAGIIFAAAQHKKDIKAKEQIIVDENKELEEKSFDIWYVYKGYESYLKYVSKQFTEETGIKVNLVCIADVDYITQINEKSIQGEGPDLFVANSKIMENLFLSGIALENTNTEVYNEENFAKTAIDAVSYNGKMYGYPLGFDVAVLAYNEKYITEAPKTFEDIKAYVGNESEDASEMFEGINKVFEWNVNSLIYNYGFFADYLTVEKESSDGKLKVSLNSENAIKAGKEYMALKDYFGLSSKARAYDSIVKDFAAGKTLFAILTTDILKNEKFSKLKYNVTPLPDLDKELTTSGMSYTELMVVNPYSDYQTEAVKFANMASYELSDKMLTKCGIMSCKRGIKYKNTKCKGFYKAYEESVLLPNYMETEDYEVHVTNTLNHIWQGKKISEELKALQAQYEEKN